MPVNNKADIDAIIDQHQRLPRQIQPKLEAELKTSFTQAEASAFLAYKDFSKLNKECRDQYCKWLNKNHPEVAMAIVKNVTSDVTPELLAQIREAVAEPLELA